ncbi:MAG: branched-chain amino acid ABC transporter permease [Rhodospirillales bacterium]|nr:branched-chain amino acid ABC transporter permease [Rhodospirillales bacterium]
MDKPVVTRKALVLGLGLVLLLALPPIALAMDEGFFISLFSRILIYALAAVSLDLILGYAGMASLGHGAFLGVGAYVVGILAFHLSDGSPLPFLPGAWAGTASALIAWTAAILVSALFALVIGALSQRTSGVYFIMITLAFAQMLYFFFISLSTYGGQDGVNLEQRNTFPLLDLGDDTSFYYVCLGLLLGFVFLCKRLVNSRFGMVMRGCKQNETRMRALGFATYRYKLMCFVIAGAGAGLAGALAANQSEFVSPGLMHWTRSGEIMIMVILGGMGTLFGPILGAAALLLMEDVLASYTEHWMIILGPVLIFVVLFARRGIYGFLAGPGGRDG